MQYQTNIILGSFMVLALLFLVLFFTHGRNYANLLFAAFCLVWFMRVGVTGGRVFTVIIPWLTWVWKFRIEYLAIPISAMLTLAIVNIIFKDALHKWVLKIFYYISAAFILLFFTLDTVAMRGWLDILFAIYTAAILWLFGCLLIRHRRNRKKPGQKAYNTEQRMFAVGLFLFISAAIVDFGYVTAFFHMPNFHMAGVAVLVFALCEAAAVFTSTMNRLEEAKTNEQRALENERLIAADNAALDRIDKMKTDVMEMVAHETRTPLAVLSGYIELIAGGLRRSGTDDQTAKDLDKVTDEIQRIASIMAQMQGYSWEKDNARQKTQVQLVEVISQTTRLYAPILERNKVTLTTALPEDVPTVFANAGELTQVMFNLLQNAKTHTGSGGSVTVELQAQADTLRITVADTGTGIMPELLPKVFTRGISTEKSTGLGLPLCKEIIEAHGGTIDIESKPGKGTAVCFTVPTGKERGTDGTAHGLIG